MRGVNKPTYQYKHGFPFSESLALDVLEPTYTMKRLARALIIDGIPGTGKTTLAVEIAEYLQGKPVKLDDDHVQLAMGGLELMNKALLCHEQGYKIIIYDEAADLGKRGALSKFNRQLMMFFNKYRALDILLIIVLPVFWHLDNDMFDLGFIHGLINLRDPNEHWTGYGVYDYQGMCYLRMWADKMKYNKRLAYKKQYPYMRGEFLPLPPERQSLLDNISISDKKRSMKKLTKKEVKK